MGHFGMTRSIWDRFVGRFVIARSLERVGSRWDVISVWGTRSVYFIIDIALILFVIIAISNENWMWLSVNLALRLPDWIWQSFILIKIATNFTLSL